MASPADRRAYVLLLGGNVLFGTGLFFHAFLYNFYLEALGFSESVMGHAAAALTAGGLASLIPAGWFADRVGPRAAVITAAVVATAGLALGAVVEGRATIFAAAAVAGGGGGIWRVAVPPFLMAITDPVSRPKVFAWNVGLLLASGGLGLAVAGSVPSWLEAAWQLERLQAVRAALLIGAAGSGLSVSLFASLAARRRANRERRQPLSRSWLPPRGFLLLIALVGLWMMGPALLAPFFNIYFTRTFDLPIDRVGWIFALAHLVWAPLVFSSGSLAAKVGVQRLLSVTLLLFVPAVWSMAIVAAVGPAVALYVLQGAVSPITNPLIDQVLLQRAPVEKHGVVSSWRNMAADGSAMVGASLGGTVLAVRSFGWLFGLGGFVGLLGALGLIAGLGRWVVTQWEQGAAIRSREQ
jgi:MFS family permease